MASRASMLHHYLDSFRAGPLTAAAWSWEAANCCHLAAGWVRVATGADPMAGLDPTPDARAARRQVRQLGGSLEAAVSRQLGWPAVPVSLAQLGDIVLLPVPEAMALSAAGVGQAVGICAGRTAAFRDVTGAVAHVPMSLCTCAWRLEAAC